MTIEELLASVIGKVKDDSNRVTPEDYERSFGAALKRYSKNRPLTLVTDMAGDGGHDYDLPNGWCFGFSGLLAIEYPVGAIPEELLDSRDYKLYQSPTGHKLRLVVATPEAGETFRVSYTALHTETSLPDADADAVANLAASFCCRQLAAAYGNTSDPLIQADAVNYRSKTDEYRRLADSFEGLYNEQLGLKQNDTAPAVMATANAPEPQRGRRVRLTHIR